MTALRTLRLVCPEFWADVRITQLQGRWLASADTPDGPSLGLGWFPREALADALEPFDGYADALLATVPDDLILALDLRTRHGASSRNCEKPDPLARRVLAPFIERAA